MSLNDQRACSLKRALSLKKMFSFNQACMIGLSILLLSACADIALKQQPIMDEALLDAINERELGQHQQALLKFDVLANQGNPKAIYNKGLMVLNGQGILDDYAQAQRLFESALSPLQSMAKQNDPYAQYALGDMYEYGFGTDVNTAEAARWYAKALDAFLPSAQAGDAFAQFMLAVIYRNGVGVDEDDKKVLYWLENSANQGYVQAQYMLGFMHREGQGVADIEKNKVYANMFKWYHKAAAQGHLDAQFYLGLLYSSKEADIENDVYAYVWYDMLPEHYIPAKNNIRIIKSRLTAKEMSEAKRLAAQCRNTQFKQCR